MKFLKNDEAKSLKIPDNESVVFRSGKTEWYSPVLINPLTVGKLATDTRILQEAISVLEKLEPDGYTDYLSGYYTAGINRFGNDWQYADIVTAILAAAKLIKPANYLEIGVRKGRSLAMVAATNPNCTIIALDMWIEDYAGISNPGPDFVSSEMKKVGYSGQLEFLNGNSHILLQKYFSEHPGAYFDMITVDGDHSKAGAIQDLKDVLPRLSLGGVLIFDDISHPAHPYLGDVWNTTVRSDSRFVTWEFSELGYGVAIAIRKEA